MLYRASWLLLYIIFIPNTVPAPTGTPIKLMREASAVCTAKVEEVYQLLKLYAKSFGLHNMTYIMTWSIVGCRACPVLSSSFNRFLYRANSLAFIQCSAGTISAIDLQSDDPAIAASAGTRLSMSMHVLERGISQAPGIKRSVEILKHRLRRPQCLGSLSMTDDTDNGNGVRKLIRSRSMLRTQRQSQTVDDQRPSTLLPAVADEVPSSPQAADPA